MPSAVRERTVAYGKVVAMARRPFFYFSFFLGVFLLCMVVAMVGEVRSREVPFFFFSDYYSLFSRRIFLHYILAIGVFFRIFWIKKVPKSNSGI
jgi:hypothetical protein